MSAFLGRTLLPLLTLLAPGICTATTWMINEDYKQLDARGASDFEILFDGNVADRITGGGMSIVTNPFANPSRSVSSDVFGNTIVRYTGTATVPRDTTADRHFGLFGTGKKPAVLGKRWSYATEPTSVPVPVLSTSFLYNATLMTLAITFENLSGFPVMLTEAGYLRSPTMVPIEQLNRDGLPPSLFVPLPGLNGDYSSMGSSRTEIVSGILATDWLLTYGTTEFSEDGFDYDLTAGNWAQVAAHPIPEPGAGLLLGAGLLALLVSRCRKGILAALATATLPLLADSFVLPLVPGASNQGPVVRIVVSVGGTDQVVNLLIDTGDQITRDGGMMLNNGAANNVADRLGMGAGGTAGTVQGAGGSPGATRNGVPFPGGPQFQTPPSVPGGQATKAPGLPANATVGRLPDSMDAIIGSQWLSTYQYGRMTGTGGDYFWLAAKDQGANGVRRSISIANFLANAAPVPVRPADGRPLGLIQTPLRQLMIADPAPGTDAMDGGYALDAGITLCSSCVVFPGTFLLKSAFENTLLSENTALALGLAIGTLPTAIMRHNFGVEPMPTASLLVNVFGDSEPLTALQVGILPSSMNPFNLNYLGSDFLQSYSRYWEVNTSDSGEDGTLYAISKVPEPAAFGLVGLALVLMRWRTVRRV